jgi:hypothetical protein
MIDRLLGVPAHVIRLVSQATHPFLTPAAAKMKNSKAVFALAKRIDLVRWLDPPSETTMRVSVHSLSYRRLAPWDQATIKAEIAQLLLNEHRSLLPSAGVLQITLFGTCGREIEPKATYTDDVITGFEYRERHFPFPKPLQFVQGSGVELPLE